MLRGLIGNLLEELSLGDHCFGYSSVPIEAAPLRGKGRNARPPKKYVIVEEEEEWVRRIFDWYVRDRQPIQWIVRELNRQNVPKDHRSGTTTWGRAGVRALLRRIKYIGIWPWGITTNCRDPLTGQIYKEFRPEEETQGWIRASLNCRLSTTKRLPKRSAFSTRMKRTVRHFEAMKAS